MRRVGIGQGTSVNLVLANTSGGFFNLPIEDLVLGFGTLLSSKVAGAMNVEIDAPADGLNLDRLPIPETKSNGSISPGPSLGGLYRFILRHIEQPS